MEALCRANAAYVEALHAEVRAQAGQRAACEREFAEASSRAAGVVDGLEDVFRRLQMRAADVGRGDRAALAEALWRLGEQEAFVARAETECGARVAAIAGLHEDKRRLAAELRDMREDQRATRASREAARGELEDARELVAELREREVWLQARIADLESSAGLPRARAHCVCGGGAALPLSPPTPSAPATPASPATPGTSSSQYSPTSPPPAPAGAVYLDVSTPPHYLHYSPTSPTLSMLNGAMRSASPSPPAAGAKRLASAPPPAGRRPRRGWTPQPFV